MTPINLLNWRGSNSFLSFIPCPFVAGCLLLLLLWLFVLSAFQAIDRHTLTFEQNIHKWIVKFEKIILTPIDHIIGWINDSSSTEKYVLNTHQQLSHTETNNLISQPASPSVSQSFTFSVFSLYSWAKHISFCIKWAHSFDQSFMFNSFVIHFLRIIIYIYIVVGREKMNSVLSFVIKSLLSRDWWCWCSIE